VALGIVAGIFVAAERGVATDADEWSFVAPNPHKNRRRQRPARAARGG
jgi:hypothetical protein